MNVYVSVNVQNDLSSYQKYNFESAHLTKTTARNKHTNSFIVPCVINHKMSLTICHAQNRGDLGHGSRETQMAAWRASVTMIRYIVVFLHFYCVLGMKVSITGSSHVCVTGSQVVHVNFGAGPIQQCGLLNTTPQASKEEGGESKDQAKGSDHSQGWYPCENQRIHSLRVLRLDP